MMRKFELLKVPVAFFGPYMFQCAIIEKVFSYIKMFDLNPNNLVLIQK